MSKLPLSSAIGFYVNHALKQVRPQIDAKAQPTAFMISNLATGALTGALSVFPMYPIIFARNRLAADNGSKFREFKGFGDVITKTVKNGGPTALFTGFTAGIPGMIMYRTVYFGAFDTAKALVFPNGAKDAPTAKLWMLAQSVTLLAGLSSYPFSTL